MTGQCAMAMIMIGLYTHENANEAFISDPCGRQTCNTRLTKPPRRPEVINVGVDATPPSRRWVFHDGLRPPNLLCVPHPALFPLLFCGDGGGDGGGGSLFVLFGRRCSVMNNEWQPHPIFDGRSFPGKLYGAGRGAGRWIRRRAPQVSSQDPEVPF